MVIMDDGDCASAMRYTEVRSSKISKEFLKDIEKILLIWLQTKMI